MGPGEGEREELGGWKEWRNKGNIMTIIYMISLRPPLPPLPPTPMAAKMEVSVRILVFPFFFFFLSLLSCNVRFEKYRVRQLFETYA